MKTIVNLFLIVLLSVSIISCAGENSKKTNNQVKSAKELSENLKNVEVQIKGMTCEIGCARLIQSKLYKTEGIKFAKVSFEDKLGNITFDANKISTTKIKEVIQKVGGGDLYTVVEMEEVEEFTKNQETTDIKAEM